LIFLLYNANTATAANTIASNATARKSITERNFGLMHEAKPENVKAMIVSVKKYGAYN